MKKRNMFRIIMVIFLLAVILLVADMFRKTTPPWKRAKTADHQSSLHEF